MNKMDSLHFSRNFVARRSERPQVKAHAAQDAELGWAPCPRARQAQRRQGATFSTALAEAAFSPRRSRGFHPQNQTLAAKRRQHPHSLPPLRGLQTMLVSNLRADSPQLFAAVASRLNTYGPSPVPSDFHKTPPISAASGSNQS